MAKTIQIKTEIDNKKSIKSIKQMDKELKNLKDQIEETTDPKEFKRLATEIKAVEGEFKDLNKSFEGLDSEAKAGELGKIAGGLGAIGTAAAVVGAGNEDVEKLFATFATGLAVTQGVKGAIEAYSGAQKLLKNNIVLTNIATKAAAIGTAIWGTVQSVVTTAIGATSGALKIFRLALLATGIGAIIVGIGLLIANFESVGKAIKWVGDTIYSFFKPAIDAVIDALQWLGLIASDEAQAQEEAARKTIEASIARREEVAKLQEAEERKTASIIRGLDFEISKRKILGEETEDVERKKLRALVISADTQAKMTKEKIKALTDELSARIELNEVTQEDVDAFKEESASLTKELQTNSDARIETRNELKLFNLQANQDEIDDEKRKNAEKEKEDKKASDARRKRREREEAERRKREEKELDDYIKLNEALAKIEDDFFLRSQTEEQQEIILRQQQFDNEFLAAAGNKQLQLQLETEFLRDKALIEETFRNEKAAIEDEATRERIRLEEEARAKSIQDAADDLQLSRDIKNSKISLAQDGLSVISSLTELFGKNNEKNAKKAFQINKAAQMASALISTYTGANAIFASAAANPSTILFPAQPFITAGLSVAAGLANVAKIAQTKFKSSVTAGGGAGAAASGGARVPSAPTPSSGSLGIQSLQGAGTETVGGGAGSLQQTPIIQAYVVESDISGTQNNLSSLQAQSEIG